MDENEKVKLPDGMSQKEAAEVKDLFNLFDIDGDGLINKE